MVNEQSRISNTPYDDAFHTMIRKSGSLRLPFINEMFHLKNPLPAGTRIESISSEYYIEEGRGEQRKVVADSVLHINGRTYHIECQSYDDGTILVRMFEYDINIGLQESYYDNYHLTVTIPHSGVLFLRKTAQTPNEMMVTIQAEGKNLEYTVEAVNMADYTLDDLIEKDLLFLFPFYVFNLESDFKGFENNDAESRENVITSFNELLEYVNELYQKRELTFENYLLLTDMLKKVTVALTHRYALVRKELDDIMGGKILEFKGEKIFNEGKVNELLGLVYDGAITEQYAADRAEKRYGVKKDEFKRLLASYDPNAELMQG